MKIISEIEKQSGHMRIMILMNNRQYYNFMLTKEDDNERYSGAFGSQGIIGLHRLLEPHTNRRPVNYDADIDELLYLLKGAEVSKRSGDHPAFRSALYNMLQLLKP